MPHVLKLLWDSAIKTIGIGRDIKNIKKQAQVSSDNVQPRTNQKGYFEILCDKWCRDTSLAEHCYHFKKGEVNLIYGNEGACVSWVEPGLSRG